MKDLTSKVLKGNTTAIARMITLIENNDSDTIDAMKEIHKKSGNAHVIGITGVMGSGKSSLIFELAYQYRKQGKKVGIIAVDPTSPFSGGALLGDRVRMMELATDDDVFIRSMGTHGMLGGLASSVFDVVEIFDAAGMDIILIETVGVGQAEVDIVKIADTTLVVLVPGLGDSIRQPNGHSRTYLPGFAGTSRRILESGRSDFASDSLLYVRNTTDLGIVVEFFDGFHRSDA